MKIKIENHLESRLLAKKNKNFSIWLNQLELLTNRWEGYSQKYLTSNVEILSDDCVKVLNEMNFKVWLGNQSWLQVLNPLNSLFASDRLGEYLERYQIGFELASINKRMVVQKQKCEVMENGPASEYGGVNEDISCFFEESKISKILKKIGFENFLLKQQYRKKIIDNDVFDIEHLRFYLREAYLGHGACNVQIPKLHNEIVINAGSSYLLRVLTNYVSSKGKSQEQAQELTVLHEMAHSLQVNLRDNGFFWELGLNKSFIDQTGTWENSGLRMFSLLWGFLKTYEKSAPTLSFAGSWLREAHADVLSVMWYSQIHLLKKDEILDLLFHRIKVRKEQSTIISREPFAGISVHETHGALSILKQRIDSGVVNFDVIMSVGDLLNEARLCAIASLKLRAKVLEKKGLTNKYLIEQSEQLICLSNLLSSLELGVEQTFEQLWNDASLVWVDNPALVAKTSYQVKAVKAYDKEVNENKEKFFDRIKNNFGIVKNIDYRWFSQNHIDVKKQKDVFG